MRISRLITGIATLFVLPAAMAIEFPNEIDDVIHAAEVSISRTGVTVANQADPLLAEVADAPSFARADYGSGKLRGRAFIEDAFGDFTLSAASLVVELRNNSATVLSLDPGDLKLEVSAAFQRTLGTELNGTVGNTLVANLAAVVVDDFGNVRSSGTTNIVYRYTDSVDDQAPDLVLRPDVLGGFAFSTSVFDAGALDVDLLSSALTVLPGETLAISAFVSGSATGFAFFGGTGFSATTDFGNTASLFLQLPAGFRISSDVALPWVTTTPVPEPAAAALLAAGLLLLGACGVVERRRADA